MMNRFFKIIGSTRFHMTMATVTILYLFGLYYYEYKKELFPENFPAVKTVEESINKLSSNIMVGLYVNEFPTFSFNKNEFTMEATVWFKYPFGTESLRTIEQFSFDNGKVTEKSSPFIKILKDDVMVSYDITVEFKAPLDHSHYPLGGHRLIFTLLNRGVSPNELTYTAYPEDFELNENLVVSTWKAVGKNVKAGFDYATLYKNKPELNSTYPIVVFSIDFDNDSTREIISLFLPLFFIFFLGLFVLLVDVREDLSRLDFLLIPLPLLVLDRLVIDALSPSVSQVTKIDFIYFLLVFLSLVITLFQMYSMLYLRHVKLLPSDSTTRIRKMEHIDRMNSIVLLVVTICMIVPLTINAFM